jgi:hypothetical protein
MESKIDATDRWRQEGRWSEVTRFMDQERARLKAERVPGQEAKERAWAAAIEKFPPLPTPQVPQGPLRRLRSMTRKVPATRCAPWGTILQWLVKHLDAKPSEIDLDRVPARECLSLLLRCWEDRQGFEMDVLRHCIRGGIKAMDEQPPATAEVGAGPNAWLAELASQLEEDRLGVASDGPQGPVSPL